MRTLLAATALVLAGAGAEAQSAGGADPGYRVGVVSESGDIVTWLVPQEGGRLVQDRVIPLGIMPADIDGPHNLAVAPDGRAYYVTIAHGTPFGTLWKLAVPGDTLLGRAQLELFPTTIALTPDGELAFVANSDFHGDHPRTNVVSVVHTPTMTTITHLPACDMPHGVRSNAAGTRVYVSCMHSDELLEIEVATLRVARRARTGTGHAQPASAGHPAGHRPGQAAEHGASAPGTAAGPVPAG
ncbi:MAG TPA: YncE family protein, partial [Gemmatimonadales bacterium]|nr:YncE family protein [Gemmatimonadales bacterium]